MKRILAPSHARVLERLARSNALLGFDFDGTLAPIVDQPRKAVLRVSTRALLRQLARRYPCVVISGRAHADVQARLEGTGIAAVIGNHGVEPSPSAERYVAEVARWNAGLQASVGGIPGIQIENKRFSIAVHYRRCDAPEQARERIVAAARGLGPMRVIGGKHVVNLLPEGAPHKGQALARVLAEHGCDAGIFVGDDETDEDVFASRTPRLISVRVGMSRASAAPWGLDDQRAVDDLLREMLRLREGAPMLPEP